MASDGNKLGAGFVGLGVGALVGAALTSRSDRHAAFMNRLLATLAPAGISLVAADLGQDESGPVWLLTVRLSNGHLMNFQARVDPGDAPLEPSQGERIAHRIITYLQPYGLLPHDARSR